MHTTLTQNIRQFAHEHDDLPAFHAGYVVIALLCAVLLPLGAFALLIAIHALLDIVKYREVHNMSWKRTGEGVVREGLVDFTLLMVGFTSEVYLHSSIGIESVSGLLRTEFFVLELLGTTLPKFTILHHFLKITAHLHHYMHHKHTHIGKKFSHLEFVCVSFAGVAMLLLVFAPFLLSMQGVEVLSMITEELAFWNL